MSKFTLIIIFLSIYFLANIDATGQVRPRLHKDSVAARLNGNWYDASTYQYEHQFPKLNDIPPLSYTMDYETLLSYIFLDSITKYASSEYIYQNYLNRWVKNKTKNDTTINAIKYQYKIIDSDPIRFHQYHWNMDTNYINSIMNIKGMVRKLFYSILGYNPIFGYTPKQFIAIEDMFRADYIFKIHVNYIDSLPRHGYPKDKGLIPNEYIYQINATVLDTLKGKVFQNCYQAPMIVKPSELLNINSEICFNYITGPYSNDISPFILDPILLNYEGNLKLSAGQDLIVFLSYGDYTWDYDYDYFQLSLFTVYPILNNEVKDISKVWSQDTSLPYQNWKLIFENKKNNILTGGY